MFESDHWIQILLNYVNDFTGVGVAYFSHPSTLLPGKSHSLWLSSKFVFNFSPQGWAHLGHSGWLQDQLDLRGARGETELISTFSIVFLRTVESTLYRHLKLFFRLWNEKYYTGKYNFFSGGCINNFETKHKGTYKNICTNQISIMLSVWTV